MSRTGKEEIAQRLMDWAFTDAQREFSSGFPLVRLLDTQPAKKYLSYLTSLPTDQVTFAIRTLVRRTNEPTLFGRHAQLSEREIALVNDYLGRTSTVNEIPDPNPPKRTTGMRKALRRTLTERLKSVCGPNERLSGNEWVHSINRGPITVETWVDLGGRSALSYSHTILLPDGSKIAMHLSILRWLGATSMTRWPTLSAEQVFPTVDALTCVVGHFIDEMTILFREAKTA